MGVSEPEPPKPNELSGADPLRRLGKNLNGYFGETIDLPSVLGECITLAKAHGWTVGEIRVDQTLSLPTLTRPGAVIAGEQQAATHPQLRVYISTGIHGDEPAGPLAIRDLLRLNQWPQSIGFWLCPCLNPTGFRLNRRENAEGLDLNRQYLRPQALETVAHIAWLESQPSFDLCLCLHEDWEALGFYIYELNPDNRPTLAEDMVRRVAEVCPIDISELIEGRPARGGIIRPSIDPRDRPQWPESFYLLTYKTQLSYTLEAPSDYPLVSRVAALVAAVSTALETFSTEPPFGSAGRPSSVPVR